MLTDEETQTPPQSEPLLEICSAEHALPPQHTRLSSTWDLVKAELGLNLLWMDFNLRRCRDDNVNIRLLHAWFYCK